MTVSAFILCTAGLVVSLVILGATRMAMLSFLPQQRTDCSSCGHAGRPGRACKGCERDAAVRQHSKGL